MSRLVFHPLPVQPSGACVRIDTASGSNSPASGLLSVEGSPILSTLASDGVSGAVPAFLGPGGTTTLYVKTLNSAGAVTATATLAGTSSGSAPPSSTDLVAALVNGAPGSLDTLGEVATALAALPGAYPSQVNHGSTAGTARTAGATVVEWYGSVAPTNAASGDRWWDTTTELWKRYTGSAWVAAGSSTYAPTSLTPRVDALEVATAPAGVKTAKSYVVIDKAATANSYNFPARLRPLESTRRDLRVRNNGTTTVQLGYAALSQANSNYNGPASWTVTLAPGAEYPEPPGMSGALYIRPNTSGQGLRVGVYCEIGVL